MKNKDWREQFKQEFGIHFSDSEFSFAIASIESLLKSKQEEIEKVKFNRYDEYGDFCEEVVGLDDIIKILK